MTSNEKPILIIGAGIAGLTLALSLHAHGIRNFIIIEAAEKLLALGVGINVQPSAILILRNLGLQDELLRTGITTKDLRYYNRHGNEILVEKRGYDAGYTVPQISIVRGEFQLVLLKAVIDRMGKDVVKLGRRVVGVRQNQDSITAIVEQSPNGQQEEFHGRLLIGADGINSNTRKTLYPDEGPPRFSGKMLWRGFVELEKPYLTGASMIWGGHSNQKFIAYPISRQSYENGKSLVNWICELRVRAEDDKNLVPPKTNWLETVPKSRFLPSFKGWEMGGLNVTELVECTEKIYEFPMCDRDPVPTWNSGLMTLIGDAAHPMYPIGSNGASQAILDVEALTKVLLEFPNDYRAALDKYQSMRLPPTAKIVYANRANGPEEIMQVAEQRAPDGFTNINDIISQEEIEKIGLAYKVITGSDLANVNKKAEETKGMAEALGVVKMSKSNL